MPEIVINSKDKTVVCNAGADGNFICEEYVSKEFLLGRDDIAARSLQPENVFKAERVEVENAGVFLQPDKDKIRVS